MDIRPASSPRYQPLGRSRPVRLLRREATRGSDVDHGRGAEIGSCAAGRCRSAKPARTDTGPEATPCRRNRRGGGSGPAWAALDPGRRRRAGDRKPLGHGPPAWGGRADRLAARPSAGTHPAPQTLGRGAGRHGWSGTQGACRPDSARRCGLTPDHGPRPHS